MTVQIFICCDEEDKISEYTYSHELVAVRNIARYMWERFNHLEKIYSLVANTQKIGSGEKISADLVIISELGMGVVELKDYFGVITCNDPSGKWFAGPQPIKGSKKVNIDGYNNPYEQVINYSKKIQNRIIEESDKKWIPVIEDRLRRIKIDSAVCFTNPGALLSGCKEAVQLYYRKVIPDGLSFTVLTPGEISGWSSQLRFEIPTTRSESYQPVKLTPLEIERISRELFGAVYWEEISDQMVSPREPFGYLHLIVRGTAVQTFRLEHDETIIGRHSESCNIVVSERYHRTSRVHAKVVRVGGHVFLEDAHSTYGTYLDGRNISERVRLSGPSQEITLGYPRPRSDVCHLRFSVHVPDPGQTGINKPPVKSP